jgi:hypothetical protein
MAVWDLSPAALAGAGAAAVAPVLTLPAAHQSGVNALAVACLGAGRLLLLTGGDDQALRLTQLRVSAPQQGIGGLLGIKVVAELHLPNAHASSVKVRLERCGDIVLSRYGFPVFSGPRHQIY